MRVHHLNCGTMCPRGRRLINGSGGLFAQGRLVCHCLLLETREGLCLVDSGFGLNDVLGPERLGALHVGMTGARLDPDETATRQIARLGLSPSDVRHVVVTHLDFDHVGGVSDFPAAKVHVHAREHAAAMARASLLERNRYLPKQWAHGPDWALHQEAGEGWFGFDAVKALPGTDDEVLLVPLFGHTRGHSGVAVRGDGGWLLHAGDSYFHHGEIYPDSGECPTALRLYQSLIEMDRGARLENQRRLSALVRERRAEVRVFSAHDPFELDRAGGAPSALAMRPLLLASTSPFRVALLRRLGLAFRAVAPLFDETPPRGASPRDCARIFAEGKAQSSGEPLFSGLVIGGDQTLDIDGEMLRKARSPAESIEQLLSLSGRVHLLHAAVAVFEPTTGRLLAELTTVELTMRPLERAEAVRYVALDKPSGSAGGYLFEKRGIALFDAVRGEDDSAIVGLPLLALGRLLRAFGVDPLGD